MKIKFTLICAIIILVILNSCSNTETTATKVKANYFPATVGNYWIYQTYQLNQDTVAVSGTDTYDSIVIAGKVEMLGKIAYKFLDYRLNNGIYEIVDTMYYYKNGDSSNTVDNSISLIFNETNSQIPNLGDFWFKISDFTTTFDNSYNVSISNYIINFLDTTIACNPNFIINSRYDKTDNISFLNTTKSSLVYTLKNDRLFEINYTFRNGIDTLAVTIDSSVTRRKSMWFIDGAGIVAIEDYPYTIKCIPSPNSGYYTYKFINVNGLKRELVRFKIQ